MEIKKLNAQVNELESENSELLRKLNQKNYESTYKENKLLQLEVKNMYILQEENNDLREDLERLQKLSYDERIKEMAEENLRLRKRNGEQLMQLEESKKLIEQLKASTTASSDRPQVLTRPQTASVMGRKKEEMLLTEDDLLEAQSQFDKELNELLAKNQKNLLELHNDVKEVSKITGEATINVRKIAPSRKVLK